MSKFRYVSLFSGIGGFDLALNRLGGECVMASEIDKYATKAYEVLYGHKPQGDVTKIHVTDVPDHDILAAGFPCQAFSVAGKRLGFEDTRGTLFFEVVRIAQMKKPKLILLENVKGLLSHDGGRTLDIITTTLSEVGYAIDFTVLNSKHFAVLRNRERWFCVAVRDYPHEDWVIPKKTDVVTKAKRRIADLGDVLTFNFDWPKNETVTNTIRDILEDNVDERYYLSEEKTTKLIEQLADRHADESDKFLIDDQGRTTKELRPLNISPTLRRETHGNEPRVVEPDMQMLGLLDIKGNESIRRVDATEGIAPTLTTMGGGMREPKVAVQMNRHEIEKETDISHCLMARDYKGFGNQAMTGVIEEVRPVLTPDREEKRQNGRRFKDDGEESFTLTAQDRHGVAIGTYPTYRIRKLIPLECFRLQGFPDDFHGKLVEAGISDSQRYKMAGNAVTVNVIEAIGSRLLPLLSERCLCVQTESEAE